MPEDKPATDLIMVATGTGIAPYRLVDFQLVVYIAIFLFIVFN